MHFLARGPQPESLQHEDGTDCEGYTREFTFASGQAHPGTRVATEGEPMKSNSCAWPARAWFHWPRSSRGDAMPFQLRAERILLPAAGLGQGMQLDVYRRGDGATVVFLHGIASPNGAGNDPPMRSLGYCVLARECLSDGFFRALGLHGWACAQYEDEALVLATVNALCGAAHG